MKKFYVYVDLTVDTLTPFYCGKGDERRFKCGCRNDKHKSISMKHGRIRVCVLETLDEHAAFAKEREVIADACLNCYRHPENRFACCFRDGGQGFAGHVHVDSLEKRQKLSIGQRRFKQKLKDENRDHPNKGKKRTLEQREAISKRQFGKKKPKQAIAMLENRCALGHRHSLEIVQKISRALSRPRKPVEELSEGHRASLEREAAARNGEREFAYGENAQIVIDAIDEIKRRLQDERKRDIANEYGVSYSYLCKMLRRTAL